jgi:hypothetical protein
VQFQLNGETYEMVTNHTFGEARAIEKVTGLTMAQIAQAQSRPELQTTDVTQALVWVSMKRKEPTMKFGDLDDVDITSIEWLPEEGESEGDAPDPTEADADD